MSVIEIKSKASRHESGARSDVKVLNFNVDGEDARAFYVRFADNSLEKEMKNVFADMKKRYPELNITENAGTYMVKAPGQMSLACSWSPWDILMHRCWAEAGNVRSDAQTGMRFYAATISDQYFVCERRLA